MPKDPSLRLPPPPVPLPPPCSSYSFSSFAPVSFPLEPFDTNKSYTTYKKKRGRVSRQHHIFFQRRQNRRSSSTQPPTTIHFGETIPIDSLPSAAVVFAPPSREHDSLRVQLVCVFFVFFFPPPFPCFAFSLRAKTRAFSHERSFPFPGPHARTLSSQMGQCARKATGRAHHCARARVLFANGEGSGRERWESVSFFFFPTCFTTQSCSLIFLTVTRLFTAHFQSFRCILQ